MFVAPDHRNLKINFLLCGLVTKVTRAKVTRASLPRAGNTYIFKGLNINELSY